MDGFLANVILVVFTTVISVFAQYAFILPFSEKLKRGSERDKTLYNYLHQEKAKAIMEIHEAILNMEDKIISLYFSVEMGDENLKEQFQEFSTMHRLFRERVDKYSILFSDDINDLLKDMQSWFVNLAREHVYFSATNQTLTIQERFAHTDWEDASSAFTEKRKVIETMLRAHLGVPTAMSEMDIFRAQWEMYLDTKKEKNKLWRENIDVPPGKFPDSE